MKKDFKNPKKILQMYCLLALALGSPLKAVRFDSLQDQAARTIAKKIAADRGDLTPYFERIQFVLPHSLELIVTELPSETRGRILKCVEKLTEIPIEARPLLDSIFEFIKSIDFEIIIKDKELFWKNNYLGDEPLILDHFLLDERYIYFLFNGLNKENRRRMLRSLLESPQSKARTVKLAAIFNHINKKIWCSGDQFNLNIGRDRFNLNIEKNQIFVSHGLLEPDWFNLTQLSEDEISNFLISAPVNIRLAENIITSESLSLLNKFKISHLRLDVPKQMEAEEIAAKLSKFFESGWDHLQTLEFLDFGSISDQEVRALANSKGLTNLQYLNLSESLIDDDGAKALAESTTLTNLREVNLEESYVTDDGAKALVESATLTNLQELRYGRTPLILIELMEKAAQFPTTPTIDGLIYAQDALKYVHIDKGRKWDPNLPITRFKLEYYVLKALRAYLRTTKWSRS